MAQFKSGVLFNNGAHKFRKDASNDAGSRPTMSQAKIAQRRAESTRRIAMTILGTRRLESTWPALIPWSLMSIPYYSGFEHLCESLIGHLDDDELRQVQNAYELARVAHAGQMRDEGTPYILHPVRVATILSDELEVYSHELICAALLHDVIEDCDVSREQLKVEFGDTVARIVWLLTKVREISLASYVAAIEEASDIRAPIVKLCDRLDNLRFVMRSPKADKKRRYIKTTEQYYLPLAARTDKYLHDKLHDALQLARASVFRDHRQPV